MDEKIRECAERILEAIDRTPEGQSTVEIGETVRSILAEMLQGNVERVTPQGTETAEAASLPAMPRDGGETPEYELEPSAAPEDSLPADRNWEELVRLHPRHPALEQETIYALPEGLLAAIVKEIPELFTAEEKRFERDLARLGGAGFFLRWAFAYGVVPDLVPADLRTAAERDLAAQTRRAAASINTMVLEDMRMSGWPSAELQTSRETEAALHGHFDSRRWGYAGWLATDPGFRAERDRFRKRWGDRIATAGRFPRVSLCLAGRAPAPPPETEEDREFHSDCRHFYETWGVTLFLPWHLLRDQNLKIGDVIEQRRASTFPPHLREWAAIAANKEGEAEKGQEQRGKKTKNRKKRFGPARYRTMLQLFLLRTLALKSRYAERLKGNEGRLDRAFGEYLRNEVATSKKRAKLEEERGICPGDAEAEDSMKKTRLELQARLKRTSDIPDHAPSADRVPPNSAGAIPGSLPEKATASPPVDVRTPGSDPAK
jgi:hypothetical protein